MIFNYVQADFGMMNLLSHVFFWMNDAVVFLVYVQIIFNLSISRLVSEVGYSAAASACEKGERWKWAIWAADCGLNIALGMVAAIWECLKVVCTPTSNDTLDWGKYRKTVIKKKNLNLEVGYFQTKPCKSNILCLSKHMYIVR